MNPFGDHPYYYNRVAGRVPIRLPLRLPFNEPVRLPILKPLRLPILEPVRFPSSFQSLSKAEIRAAVDEPPYHYLFQYPCDTIRSYQSENLYLIR